MKPMGVRGTARRSVRWRIEFVAARDHSRRKARTTREPASARRVPIARSLWPADQRREQAAAARAGRSIVEVRSPMSQRVRVAAQTRRAQRAPRPSAAGEQLDVGRSPRARRGDGAVGRASRVAITIRQVKGSSGREVVVQAGSRRPASLLVETPETKQRRPEARRWLSRSGRVGGGRRSQAREVWPEPREGARGLAELAERSSAPVTTERRGDGCPPSHGGSMRSAARRSCAEPESVAWPCGGACASGARRGPPAAAGRPRAAGRSALRDARNGEKFRDEHVDLAGRGEDGTSREAVRSGQSSPPGAGVFFVWVGGVGGLGGVAAYPFGGRRTCPRRQCRPPDQPGSDRGRPATVDALRRQPAPAPGGAWR